VRGERRLTSAAGKTENRLFTAASLRATFAVSESIVLCFSRLALGGQKQVHIATHIALVLVAHAALQQSPSSTGDPSKTTIRSDSALVIVPTLVQSHSGELNLAASHFRLSDNGIKQKVSVEPALNQPLAIVVLVQNGGAASSQLQNYGKLDTILESVLGSSTRTVALVTTVAPKKYGITRPESMASITA
jgi:hypothetical protein